MTEGGFELERLRIALRALQSATAFEEAVLALEDFAAALTMPTMSWASNASHPYFDPNVDAFLRRQGWRDEDIAFWWNSKAALKTTGYIRCRFEHLPFASGVTPAETSPEGTSPWVEALFAAKGIKSTITLPMHLPKGQIALLAWGSASPVQEAERILDAATPEILAAGHCFMRVANQHAGIRGVSNEELARLTPREWDCLRLTAQGYREAEVAKLMNVASTTVRYHLDNVIRKLGATSRVHAVAIAAQLGLLGSIGS